MALILGGDAAAGRGGDPRGDRARRGLGRAARRPRARCPGWRSRRCPARGGRRALAARPRAGAPRGRARRSAALPFAAQPDRPRPGRRRDRWAVAESTYREAIELARESGQRDRARLRRSPGWPGCRRGAGASRSAGRTRPRRCALAGSSARGCFDVWAAAALGELELGLGDEAPGRRAPRAPARAPRASAAISDVDLSPGGGARRRLPAARPRRGGRRGRRRARGAARGQGAAVVAGPRARAAAGCSAGDAELAAPLRGRARPPRQHARRVRGRRAPGSPTAQRLRRARQPRRSPASSCARRSDTFERLGARPWADRARAELAASGRDAAPPRPEHARRADPAGAADRAAARPTGRTTREAAAALFLSPKTIEYHLRHVYLKLDIHSREELTAALAARTPG